MLSAGTNVGRACTGRGRSDEAQMQRDKTGAIPALSLLIGNTTRSIELSLAIYTKNPRLVVAQFDVERCDGVVEMFRFSRSDDGRGNERLLQHVGVQEA